MLVHAVHSEGNQCEILVAPIECTVEMALRLETAIVGLVSVTASPHPSGSPADFNLKPLNYSGLAPADSIVFQLLKSQ